MKKGLPKWLIVIIVIVICAFVFTNTNDDGKNDPVKTGTTVPITEKFTLEEGFAGYYDGYFAYYIEGFVKNNRNKEYSYVQITFKTYDKDGNTLGSCVDNNSGLDANGRWKFKAICLDGEKDIASYKLDEITGW
jgi:uncharacterized protein YxeA